MTLIAEFELSTPILRQAREEHPEVRIRIETIFRSSADEFKLIFWVRARNFEGVDSAIAADRTVRDATLLEATDTGRLYRVTLSESGAERLTYPVAAHHDITFLDITARETARVRARFPDREALFAYRDVCREKDVPFQIRRIYREDPSLKRRYGLTEGQREALRAALEAGYFEVPRETELGEIAAELDVSTQALSARIRRGQRNLLLATLGDDAT